MSKVHLRFFIIQFLLVILVLMAFLVRSVVNLTLTQKALIKTGITLAPFISWKKNNMTGAIISLYMPCIPIYLNYNLVNYYYHLLLVLFYMTLLKHLKHY